jgi:integrase
LRWGELAGLRQENIDLEACEIRIVETTAELDKGGLLPDTPKSRAGRRVVAFPAELVPDLRWHLERFAAPGERGWYLSVRRAALCAGLTSGRPGMLPASRQVRRISISMICGM